MLSAFKWILLISWCDAFVRIVSSDEPRKNQGRGLVDRELVKAPPPPPSNFIAGHPKAALLFRFCFGSLVILDVARYPADKAANNVVVV